MNEYLSKETLQEKLNRKKAGPANKRYTEGWNDAILMVKSMIHSEKAADVAPVRHGRWEVKVGMNFFKERNCPVCKKRIESKFWNFCPSCGCRMDLEG